MFRYKPDFGLSHGVVHITNLTKADGSQDIQGDLKVTGILNILKGFVIESAIALSSFEEAYENVMRYWAKRGNNLWSEEDEFNTPGLYLIQAPAMFADMFVFALDYYKETLPNLTPVNKVEPIILAAIQDLDIKFPDLRNIRNSAHHIEQRLEFKAQGKNIVIDPSNRMGMTLGYLSGNKLLYTIKDGTNGQIEISENSLNIVVENLKTIICEIEKL